MTARRGFTMIELLVAITIMSAVLAGVFSAFIGMRKAQATAASHNMLKAGAQMALKDMFMELSQCRKLLASSNLEPPEKDLGREYFTRFEGIASPPAVPFGNMVFPRVDANGGFGLEGANSGELERETMGNTLVFVASGPRLTVNPPGLSLNVLGAGTQNLNTTPYFLSSVRFVGYYLTEKNIADNVAPIKLSPTQSRGHTLQLMRWESRPYVERGEIESLFGKLNGDATAKTTLVTWLRSQPDTAFDGGCIWDPGALAAADAFYKMEDDGSITKLDDPAVSRKREVKAVRIETEPYALSMVAFNTTPDYKFPDFTVPAYAPTDAAHVNYPYGFEVGINGPTGARSVLIRLALAARVHTGMHLFGYSQQQVVKVVDM